MDHMFFSFFAGFIFPLIVMGLLLAFVSFGVAYKLDMNWEVIGFVCSMSIIPIAAIIAVKVFLS